MKAIFKKMYVMVIAAMFMVIGAGTARATVPPPNLSTAGGYSCPAYLTIPVGSSRTLLVKEPAGTFSSGYVQYNAKYVQTSNFSGGTRGKTGGKSPQITFKGIKPGSFTGYFTITSFKTKMGGEATGVYRLTYHVTVVDSNTKSTAASSGKIPLTKIALNKTSQALDVGKTASLSVTYYPSNTTDSKSVVWSSSNSKVAVVSGGKVTAKASGTATITAKVGTKIASCVVQVKAVNGKETYRNVSEAYTLLNTFRTTKANQWYWNSSNTKKITTYGLKTLYRSTTLENLAKLRAKEQWIQYNQNGKATHDRPNGKSWETAFPAGMKFRAENLIWDVFSARAAILDADGWAETNKPYAKQGHRRNMLDSRATMVGIACYEKDGKTCWAMCLGA